MNLGNGGAVIGVGVGMGTTPCVVDKWRVTRTGAFDVVWTIVTRLNLFGR